MADVIADVTAVGTGACKKRFSGYQRVGQSTINKPK
jgi:hypothetical protein